MFTKSSKWQRLSFFAALAIVAAAAACSGGGNPTPVYPSGASNAVAGSTYQLPNTNGLNSTITVSGTGTLSVSASAAAPSVGAIPMAKQRAQTGTPNQSVLYYTITATSTLTIKTVGVSIGFTAAPATSVYLAYWNGTEWIANSTAGTYANGVESLSLPGSALPITLQSGQSLYIVAYEGQQIGTPPPPAPIVSPTAITIPNGTSQTISVTSKPGQTLTAKSSDTTIVTVSPASTAVPGSGSTGSVTFTLTATDKQGTATVTFTDSIGQTGSIAVTTNDTFPSPVPTPSAATIGLGSNATVTITTQPGSTVTASSANSSIASVPSSETAASSGPTAGQATFTITAVAAGTTTITFTDTFGNTGTMPVTISAFSNGNFANGTTGWTPCSYLRSATPAPMLNPVTPLTVTPAPTQSPNSFGVTPYPSASLPPISATAAPANDNPGFNYTVTPLTYGNGSATITEMGATFTIDTPSGAPSVLGQVLHVGTNSAAVEPYPAGVFGACQTVTIPATTPYIAFWVFEGGNGFTFKSDDQEAALLTAPGGTVEPGGLLLAEMNCYLHPANGTPPGIWGGTGVSTAQGCWPQTYGGDSFSDDNWIEGGFWSPRGPFPVPPSLLGTPVTFFVGIWSATHSTSATSAEFMYIGNVQTVAPLANGSPPPFPVSAPYSASRSIGTLTLTHRSVQAKPPIR